MRNSAQLRKRSVNVAQQIATKDSSAPRAIVRRWETVDRYYEARVEIDLFDQCILTTINGGLGNRLGNSRVVAVDDQVAPMLTTIEKLRLAHGYVEVKTLEERRNEKHSICL